MAQVRIDRYDAEDGRLPRQCMQCGAPTDMLVDKQMQWQPPWVLLLLFAGLIPCLIVALIMTKRIRLRAPMCHQHRNHWFGRSLTAGLSFLGLFLVCVAALLLISIRPNRGRGDELFGLFCAGSLVLFVVWLVVVAVMNHTSIRPKQITDHFVELTNVSPIFFEELEQMYAEDDEVRRRRRRRRRPPDDDWEEESPPPPLPPPTRRPAPPDAYKGET